MTSKRKMTLGAIGAAGIAAALALQHRTTMNLREENQTLQQQIADGGRLGDENQRLSNLVAQASAKPRMSEEQFRELLRLRGEASLLRKQKQEYDNSRAGETQLRSAQTRMGAPGSQPAQEAQDHLAPDSLACAGYAQPRAAFETHLWASLSAARSGDAKAMLDSFTPEERARWLAIHKTEEAVAAQVRRNWTGITGFRILNEQAVSDEEVVLTVYVEGVNVASKMRLKQIGGEWKFDRQLGLN